jgi:hypothetical protein
VFWYNCQSEHLFYFHTSLWEGEKMRELSLAKHFRGPLPSASPCEHRTVSKSGRIICKKIVEGENEVSPNVCRTCPVKSIHCKNLRFTLRQITPSPLLVRYNGRTEIWDDDPPEVQLEQAACTAKVMPIEDARTCAQCALRQPLHKPVDAPARRPQQAEALGKVVPFPNREPVAAAG